MGRKGYNVIATMRNPEKSGDSLAAEAKATGAELSIMPLDVTDRKSIDAGIGEVLKAKGRIDILVNNAGVVELSVVEKTSEALARETFETNFFGALWMMKAVLPGMRERRSGTIVNVSSVAGRVAVMGQSMYCASKSALESLSECLAIEVREFGIRIVIIEPGMFKTEMVGRAAGTQVDDASPYARTERRLAAIYANAVANGADPTIAAEAIELAISAETATLRHAVGVGAGMIAMRNGLSDEQWIELSSAR
jgi:NAD(P)-dependent dehydrogenase (short-subunit alcohol dehydrogenase family)